MQKACLNRCCFGSNCIKQTKTLLLFLLFTSLSCNVFAQGNLLLTPRRVVLEGGKRNAELNVANTGKDSARYVVSLVELRMKEDGTFETITEPDSGQNFATPHLRFFPRSVYLGPNEAQMIKVQVRNPGQLKPGEYRSHIYLRAVPDQKPLGTAPPPEDSSSISVKLTAVFGFTIPIIVRIGEPDIKVEISDLAFNVVDDTLPILSMTLHRMGNMSTYGDLAVEHVSPDGSSKNIYLAKGLAVYAPNRKRQVKLNLGDIKKVNFHAGSLKVIYTDHSDAKKILAENELRLQ